MQNAGKARMASGRARRSSIIESKYKISCERSKTWAALTHWLSTYGICKMVGRCVSLEVDPRKLLIQTQLENEILD
jgi:hypothetical protein